jgi:hypothetical protein
LRIPKGDKIYNTYRHVDVSRFLSGEQEDFLIITWEKSCLNNTDEEA